MAATLGSTTYTAVTWTAGDIATEAKMDNMVANDQAYDAHAAEGLLLNNNKSFAAKNAAGSNLNLLLVDGSDQVKFGDAGLTFDTSNGMIADEDDMASDSAAKLATQQSIKAYVDKNGAGPQTFQPQDNQPPSSNFATIDTRNGHYVLDFDASTDEEAIFKGRLNPNYGGGGLTIGIHASFTSATAGNVVIQAAIERIGDAVLDIDSDSFAALNSSGAVAVPGTSGLVKRFTVTFTDGADMDSLAAGEMFRLKIRRDADDTSATDSATGDMELHLVTVEET